MKKLPLFLTFLPLLSFAGIFNEYAEKIATGTHDFEKANQIENWNAVNGSVSISSKRAKQGKQSSVWSWKNGGYLLLNDPVGITEACEAYEGGSPENFERKYVAPGMEGGVKLWMYNEKPLKGARLFIQVGHDAKTVLSNPRFKIPVNLDFSGWRAIWVHFNQDAKVADYSGKEDMHSMALVPAKGSSGELYIDWMNFVSYMSLKRHSDYQVTNNKPHDLRHDSYRLLEYDQGLKNITPAPFGENEKEAFQTLEERYEFLVLGSDEARSEWMDHFKKQLRGKYEIASEKFRLLNITQSNGAFNGLPLFSGRDEHNTPEGMIFQEQGAPIMFPLALEYRLTGNKEALEKLLTVLDYFNDQGWAVGSALGTTDHMIRVNGYANAVALIRNELAESNRLERESKTLAWFSMLGSAYSTPENEGVNTDLVRGGALPKLLSVLLMEDGPEKAGAMKGLLKYFNQICGFAPGYSDTIKPDYSLYHHRSAYQSAYGVSMVTTMVMVDWLLDGTAYELSANSKKILHETLEAQMQMANKYDLHPGVSGRIQTRTALNTHLLPAFAFAEGMEAQFNYLYSPELNEFGFPGLTYAGTLGTAEQMAKAAASAGLKKTGPEDGHYTFPYAAHSTHRRGNWMAAVRGWSQYIWDFESGSKHENDLGRYISHGAMYILPENGYLGSSQNLDLGYHWGFLPGATTKEIPVEKTIFKYVATLKYLECKHRNFTDETFVGGVKLGQSGFFSMKLHDTVAPDDERILFDDSFRATKSYFFVGNKIYCLGTGIENTDTRFNTVTTLFQNTSDAIDPKINNGVLHDVNGNAYVVPNGQRIKMTKSVQESYNRVSSKLVKNSGPNVRAWLDHGKAPSGESYEYMIAVQSEEEVPTVPFKVLQKDSNAHILQHNTLTAYAIFEPGRFKGLGAVNAVDTPLLIMTREQDDRLRLSVADPDLRLKKWGHNMSFMPTDILQAEAEPHTARIILKGNWSLVSKIDGIVIVHEEDNTIIEATLQHGLTKELVLRK